MALRLVYSTIGGHERRSVGLAEHDIRLLRRYIMKRGSLVLMQWCLASDGIVGRGVLVAIASSSNIEIGGLCLIGASRLVLSATRESFTNASSVRSLTIVRRGVLSHDEVG